MGGGWLHLTSCWTPFFWHSSARSGALASAVYSAFMSAFVLAYTAYVMSGGDSSQLWLPFFETNLDGGSLAGWGSFALAYFLLLLAASGALAAGIRWEVRGLMLPWMILMLLVILFQVLCCTSSD